MNNSDKDFPPPSIKFERIVDLIIRLLVLFLLLGWCFDIIRPFILILIWGSVISIALFPIHSAFSKLLGGRKTLAAVIITLFLLCIIIIPAIYISQSLFDGVQAIRDMREQGKPFIPPPGDRVAGWPSFTKPLIEFWQLASDNFEKAALKYSEQLKSAGKWMLGAFAGIGKGILQFVVSIIIAGIMLTYSLPLSEIVHKLFIKLSGKKGNDYASVTVGTIRNVVKGILGVALIQSAMAGLGFFIAGVPFAGLWTVACLILAIVQVGVGPIAIPIAIYMFSVTDTLTATILSIWLFITLVSDNILKPILLGRGAPAPTLIIFLGAIGGFIFYGFLGLFLGAVILTIGYKLVVAWLDSDTVVE